MRLFNHRIKRRLSGFYSIERKLRYFGLIWWHVSDSTSSSEFDVLAKYRAMKDMYTYLD